MRVQLASGDLRRELRAIAPGVRLAGLAMVLVGVALYTAPFVDPRYWRIAGIPTQPLATLALMAGWAAWGYVVGRRTEYLRHRAPPDEV